MVADAADGSAGWANARWTVNRSPAGVLGKQTRTPWREQALARTAELMSLLNWFQELPPRPEGRDRYLEDDARDRLCQETAEQLIQVTASAHHKMLGPAAISGAAVERAIGLLNAAEANILRLAPARYVLSAVPNLLARAKLTLPDTDPRVRLLDTIADDTACGSKVIPNNDGELLPDATRGAIIAAFEGANLVARNEQLRVRSFRNVILSTAVASAVLVVLIGLLGFLNPTWAPMCFEPPGEIVCPTSSEPESATATIASVAQPWDTAVICFVGMLGATVSGAAALRGMRSSAEPHSLPVALAVLKLPIGALTATLGLLLISAGFVPGLSALDSPAQIIAWAILLGYAQQLFTRFVDSQAQTVLDKTRPQASDKSTDAKGN